MTLEERRDRHRKLKEKFEKSNPMASVEELKSLREEAMLGLAMKWRIAVLQGEKAFLLAEKKREEELLERGPAQTALLNDFNLSLTEDERSEIFSEVKAANPRAGTKELGSLLRSAKLQAALAWCRKRNQEAKDSSLSSARAARNSPLPFSGAEGLQAWKKSREQNRKALSLSSSGTIKHTDPLSLEAQSKSDQSTTGKFYLSLTNEERIPIKEATRLANPNADDKAFNLAYKIALWNADCLKSGVNPGQSWEDVDFSPISDTYSEDSDQDTSDGELTLNAGEIVDQRNGHASSPQENEFLAGFMKPLDKPKPDTQAKRAMDTDSSSLAFSLQQAGIITSKEEQLRRAGDAAGHGGSMSAQHGTPSLVPQQLHLLMRCS